MTTTPTPDEIRKRVERALQRTDKINQTKANLSGQLQSKRDELTALIAEIRAAGHDPKNLAQTRDQLQADLLAMVTDYEAKLDSAETALEAIKK